MSKLIFGKVDILAKAKDIAICLYNLCDLRLFSSYSDIAGQYLQYTILLYLFFLHGSGQIDHKIVCV